ncbi:hypothetical protein LTS09_001314 [Friedmanniomyces endolithicus]|nr:hypothetical protein LTS09_001314 [Friedmanniomyces endolithicus]
MAVIGSNTKNGKVISSKRVAEKEKMRLEREEAKRSARLEREKCNRLRRSAPKHTNFDLAKDAFETPNVQRNRYSFGRPLEIQIPHPKNIIFHVASQVLTEFNKTDLHRRLDPLAIEALTTAPTICHAYETEPAVFLLGRAQTFIKLQLKLVRVSEAPGAVATVLVRVGSRKYSLRAWLETLPKHRMPNIDKLALELQRQQWLKTGRPFRFERFPAEIRSRIFLFAVGPYVAPCHVTKTSSSNGVPLLERREINIIGRGTPKQDDDGWFVNAQHKQLDPVNLGLLELSRATRDECMYVLCKDTTKRYMSLEPLKDIPRCFPALYLTYLRRLELALTYIDFIDFFRCQIRPFNDPSLRYERPRTSARVLSKANLPLLRHLELNFMSTIEPDYSPWIDFGRHFFVPVTIDCDKLPCQKALVEMILCFVPRWVEHVPIVELTGFIKTETKREWERVLNAKIPRDFDAFVEDEQAAVRALSDCNLPPQCYCPHPCGFVALREIRQRYDRAHRCPHAFRDRCRCRETAPMPRDITRAAEAYFYDYDDTFKVEEEGSKEWQDRWAERERCMRVKPR